MDIHVNYAANIVINSYAETLYFVADNECVLEKLRKRLGDAYICVLANADSNSKEQREFTRLLNERFKTGKRFSTLRNILMFNNVGIPRDTNVNEVRLAFADKLETLIKQGNPYENR